MIIKIDDETLKNKSAAQISKMVTEMLNGKFNYEGVSVYNDPPGDPEVNYKFLNPEFKKDLDVLIYKYSIEIDSHTPYWIISSYIINSLLAMNCVITGRDILYDKVK